MNNKEYILETTKTLFQTLANMGAIYEEEDITFDIIEDHITEVVKKLTLTDVSQQRELLIAFHKWQQKMWTNPNSEITENVVDVYLKSNL